jgi:hypothetical protein
VLIRQFGCFPGLKSTPWKNSADAKIFAGFTSACCRVTPRFDLTRERRKIDAFASDRSLSEKGKKS